MKTKILVTGRCSLTKILHLSTNAGMQDKYTLQVSDFPKHSLHVNLNTLQLTHRHPRLITRRIIIGKKSITSPSRTDEGRRQKILGRRQHQ